MGVPVVLLAGGRGVGKKHVAGAVRGSDVSSEVTSAPWEIDTKYYRADAEIRVLGADADGSPGEDGDVQAVVVVFDVTREASFREAKALWERIKADEEAVKLLVANDPRGAGTSPTWIDEVQGWCVDNLIELVEVKHGEEGREGLDRVAEALHAHQWPGLRMKRRPGPPLRSAPAADRGESSSSNDQELPMAAFLEGGLPDDDGLARAFAMVARMKTTVDHAPHEQRKHIAARQMEELMGLLGFDAELDAASEDNASEGDTSEDAAEGDSSGKGASGRGGASGATDAEVCDDGPEAAKEAAPKA